MVSYFSTTTGINLHITYGNLGGSIELMNGFSGPEGIEKLCIDIGVDPENVAMLVIAWKMNARRMGFFTMQEWLKGFSDLQ